MNDFGLAGLAHRDWNHDIVQLFLRSRTASTHGVDGQVVPCLSNDKIVVGMTERSYRHVASGQVAGSAHSALLGVTVGRMYSVAYFLKLESYHPWGSGQ